jgi:hypothetical protein
VPAWLEMRRSEMNQQHLSLSFSKMHGSIHAFTVVCWRHDWDCVGTNPPTRLTTSKDVDLCVPSVSWGLDSFRPQRVHLDGVKA